MALLDQCLIRQSTSGELEVRLGVPLLDDYLEFVAARCRPNTVLAVAFDLKVFFSTVGKPPLEVTSSDVIAFISAQRAGGDGREIRAVDEEAALSARTIARRLSSVSGLFAYLLACGEVPANPVPRGLPTRREWSRPRQTVPLVRRPRTLPRILRWLLDGKRVELATWNGCARFAVGPDLGEALGVLRSLQTDMDRSYDELLARRLRKVTRDSGLGLQVVVVDELAFYLNVGDRKARAEFAELLRDLVARGRAAGIIVVAATQKPSVDIIPSALRDLFGFRWAMCCSTPAASDTILGQGWASRGYSAAEIDSGHRGVGYLLHEGGTPVRCKAYYLDDTTLDRVANRAETVRGTNLTDVAATAEVTS